MDNDDLPIGHLLPRREALALLGASGLALLGGPRRLAGQQAQGTGACVVRPAQTEGPYFVDQQLNRSDLRPDPSDGSVRPGVPLELAIVVSRLAGQACQPVPGVMVDLWQCDHLGVYSDVQDRSFSSIGKKFLRGYQLTDAQGAARFTTIYPGWYPGRTVHIHFKLRQQLSPERALEFTSQFYFDDALTDAVFQKAPYKERGPRSTRNASDGIYRQGGAQLMIPVRQQGSGYAGTFQVAMAGD